MDVVTLNQIKKLRETMGVSNIKDDFGLAIDNILLNLDGFNKIIQGEYIEDYFRVTPVTSLLAGLNLSNNYKVFPDYEHEKLALVGFVSSRYYAALIDMQTKTVLDLKDITYQSSWQNYSAMYNAKSTQKNGVIIDGKLYCFVDRKRYIIYDMDTYELEVKEVPGTFGMGINNRGLHLIADEENKKLYLVGGIDESGTTLYPAFLGLYELDPETNTLTLLTQSRTMMAMFSNPWDTTYTNTKFFSGVRFNQATKCIEGTWGGNYYQFDVIEKDFIKRTKSTLTVNEPQIMRHLTKVAVRDKVKRFIRNVTSEESMGPDGYQSTLTTDVLDTNYSITPCTVYSNSSNGSIYLELYEEVDIDVIKINTGGTANQDYLNSFQVITYNQAKNQVAQFSILSASPIMFPYWSIGRARDKVKYIEFRLNTSYNYSFTFHGIEFFKGFKYYSAPDSNPNNWEGNNATIGSQGLQVSYSNTYKFYMEFGEPTKLDYILAFSSNYSSYNSANNPYYVKVDAANDLEGPWTTVLNPENVNATVSNRYKFPLSTGGNTFKYYRIYTTQSTCSFRFFPVVGSVFDWNGVDESVTYQNAYNSGIYSNMLNFLTSAFLGTYGGSTSVNIQCYDSNNNALTRQYWMELPVKPIENAKYILTNTTNLKSLLTNAFRIQGREHGVSAWVNITLKDNSYTTVRNQTGQIAGTTTTTLYLYELETQYDIDCIRLEQIPIDQMSLNVPAFYFVSEEEVESLGTVINPTIQTTRFWYDYFYQQIDAPVNVTDDAYLHTDTHLHRFCSSKSKLIKINKETGLAEEVLSYSNYSGIVAPVKISSGHPAKYILAEKFQGLNTYGFKLYDTLTETFTTLLLPTTVNLTDMAAIQCYLNELQETAYFFNYANATNQLMEMNFKDDMGIELSGESFIYLKANLDAILSLTFNKKDAMSLHTSFKVDAGQILYLAFKNGGKVSVQSGKIYALWGEK